MPMVQLIVMEWVDDKGTQEMNKPGGTAELITEEMKEKWYMLVCMQLLDYAIGVKLALTISECGYSKVSFW